VPAQAAFRAAFDHRLCLDYSLEDQAFGVWECAALPKDAGFEFRRTYGKYCLRRGHGATCVQVAASGSALLLQLPTATSGTCLSHGGSARLVQWARCDPALSPNQRWVYDTATLSFRSASDPLSCLDLFEDTGEYGGDDSSRIGVWGCRLHAPNQRWGYDRYMGRYCVQAQRSVCLVEMIPGTPMRLRLPRSTKCIFFDGALQAVQEAECDPLDPKQQWTYDASTLEFRHSLRPDLCLDYFISHAAFGVWSCRSLQDINSQQQFRYDEAGDLFCLISAPDKCLQESTSALLY